MIFHLESCDESLSLKCLKGVNWAVSKVHQSLNKLRRCEYNCKIYTVILNIAIFEKVQKMFPTAIRVVSGY